MRGGGCDLFQRSAHRFGDQFQPGQIAHRGQHMGGLGALGAAFAHQPCLFEADQCEVK